MLSATGSPLVAGGTVSPMQSQFVRVLRAFFLDGKPQPVGAIIDVPRHVAAEAISCGKAVASDPPPTPPPPPPELPVVDAEPVRKPRGKRHAGNER